MAQQLNDLGIKLYESFSRRFSRAARVEDHGLKEKAQNRDLSPELISQNPLVRCPVFTLFTLESRKLR